MNIFQSRTREDFATLSRRPKFDLSECRTLSLEEALDGTTLRILKRQRDLKAAEDAAKDVPTPNGMEHRKKWPMK